MIVLAWIAAVWLLSLTLFVLMVERRTRVPRRHAKPPARVDASAREDVA